MKKTEDNSAIIENANEQVKLITDKYLPKIKKWLQDIAKISSNISYLYILVYTCNTYFHWYSINSYGQWYVAVNKIVGTRPMQARS